MPTPERDGASGVAVSGLRTPFWPDGGDTHVFGALLSSSAALFRLSGAPVAPQ